jgi:hypothetical protein
LRLRAIQTSNRTIHGLAIAIGERAPNSGPNAAQLRAQRRKVAEKKQLSARDYSAPTPFFGGFHVAF